MTALRLIRGWLALNLQRRVVFRADTLMALMQGLLFAGVMVLFFETIFGHVQALAGWTRGEMYVLLGTFHLLMQLEDSLLRRGLMSLPELVERGTLDSLLTRPGPVPLFIALKEPRPDQWVGSLPVALLLVLWGFHLNAPLGGPWALALYPLSLTLSLLLYALLVFGLTCLSFWVVRLYNLYWMLYDFVDLAQYPGEIYPGWVRGLLYTALPFAVLATFPARILLGRAPALPLLAYQGVLILGIYGMVRWIWQRGLRRYEGTSR